MMNARKFADCVGRKKMADSLQVGLTAVSNAVTRGKFPPSWIDTCRMIADDCGIDFPRELFGQIGSYESKRGTINQPIQGTGQNCNASQVQQ